MAPFTLRKGLLELHISHDKVTRLKPVYHWRGPPPAPELEGAPWADLDQQGRLVYARAGCLYAFIGGRELELADLNLDQPPGHPHAKPTE